MLPTDIIDGFENMVDLNPMSDFGVVLTKLETIEGRDIVRQFTPAPWGTGFSHRSTLVCYYKRPSKDDGNEYELIVTSYGNDSLVEKYTAEGLFGSDVIATNFACWRVHPLLGEDGTTVTGSLMSLASKMKPNGWVPDLVLPRIQQAQAKTIDCFVEAIKKKLAAK